MSVFYGSLQGCRGEATRCGSRNSGIRTSAQSYDGSVIVDLSYDENDKLQVRVGTNDDSSSCNGWDSETFRGSFEDFKKLIALSRDIKEGKVRVVRKRTKITYDKIQYELNDLERKLLFKKYKGREPRSMDEFWDWAEEKYC